MAKDPVQNDTEVVPKAWITKYLFTQGLYCVTNGCIKHNISSTMLISGTSRAGMHYHGADWHRTEEAARERARKMIKAKKKILQKKIDALATLDARLQNPAPFPTVTNLKEAKASPEVTKALKSLLDWPLKDSK